MSISLKQNSGNQNIALFSMPTIRISLTNDMCLEWNIRLDRPMADGQSVQKTSLKKVCIFAIPFDDASGKQITHFNVIIKSLNIESIFIQSTYSMSEHS